MKRPISIVCLPHNARMPVGNGVKPVAKLVSSELVGTPIYAPFTLAPESEREHEALRAWLTTHQAMFLTVAAANTALRGALWLTSTGNSPAQADLDIVRGLLHLASHLRRSSACYTFLPTIDRTVYESYLRPAMLGVRKSFSGVSSREAIEFSHLVEKLREAMRDSVNNDLQESASKCVEADEVWWKLHSTAMGRMVGVPISLAQHEYRRLMNQPGDRVSYSAFLRDTLQTTIAMDDYDRFFACERRQLDLDQFLYFVEYALEASTEYISDAEPFASYRKGTSESVTAVAKTLRQTGYAEID